MKKLLFVFLIPFIAFCGGENTPETTKTLAYYDSLTTILKNTPDTVPTQTIDLYTDEVEYDHAAKLVTIQLPKVDNKYPSVIDVHLEFLGDSIKSYKLVAGKAFSKEAPAKNYGKIEPNDTKIRIANRLKVSPANIKNKEPLRVGEDIIVGYD